MEPFDSAPDVNRLGESHHGAARRTTPGLGECGSCRYRTILVADKAGLSVVPASAPVPGSIAKRVRALTGTATMARFVWADARLLEPGHALGNLVPSADSLQSLGAAGNAASQRTAKPHRPPAKRWLRRLAPWLAALLSAGMGFLVFLHRAF